MPLRVAPLVVFAIYIPPLDQADLIRSDNCDGTAAAQRYQERQTCRNARAGGLLGGASAAIAPPASGSYIMDIL